MKGFLSCPSPQSNPDGNYRVIQDGDVLVIQKENSYGNWNNINNSHQANNADHADCAAYLDC